MDREHIKSMTWLAFVDNIELIRQAIAVGTVSREEVVKLGAEKLDRFLEGKE
jgi:hypothetical protein